MQTPLQFSATTPNRRAKGGLLLRLSLLACAALASAPPARAALLPSDCQKQAEQPSAANCADNGWVKSLCGQLSNGSDPNGPCGPFNAATGAAYQASHQQGPQTAKVFDATQNNFISSMPPPVIPVMKTRTGSQTTWAFQEELARFNAAQNNWWIPLLYTRNASYSTAPTIDSCESYVYRSFFDVERWIDGLNACHSDARCIINNSLWGMGKTKGATRPGIARNDLQDINGNNISNRMGDLMFSGKLWDSEGDPFDTKYAMPQDMTKNAFYANMVSYFPPAFIQVFADAGMGPQIQGLANELHRGDIFYRQGPGTPVAGGQNYADPYDGSPRQGFYDEWEFHSVMNTRTAAVTDGEFREYRRREAAALAQVDVVADKMKCLFANAYLAGGCDGTNLPTLTGRVHPGDDVMMGGDPLTERNFLANVSDSFMVSPPALTGQLIGAGGALQPSAFSFQQIMDGATIPGQSFMTPSSRLAGIANVARARANVASTSVALQLSSIQAMLTIELNNGAASQLLGGLNVGGVGGVGVNSVHAGAASAAAVHRGAQLTSLLAEHVAPYQESAQLRYLDELQRLLISQPPEQALATVQAILAGNAPGLGNGGDGDDDGGDGDCHGDDGHGGDGHHAGRNDDGHGGDGHCHHRDGRGHDARSIGGPAQGSLSQRSGLHTAQANSIGGGGGGGISWTVGPTLTTGPSLPDAPPFTPGNLGFGTMPWFVTVLWTTNPPQIDTSVNYPHLNCTPPRPHVTSGLKGGAALPGGLVDDRMHTRVAWVAVCEMTNLLLEEWGRKLTGLPSCLDPNNYACDWTPQDFVDRFVTQNVNYASASKEYEYKWCKRWTAGGLLTNNNPEIGVPAASRASLQSFRTFLNKREAAFEKLFATVPVKAQDDFGTIRSDSHHIGDNTFGGGIDYSLGWHAHVLAREKTGLQRICRLEGNTTASFSADAIIFGGKVPLIDAGGIISVNENNSGKSHGNAHLYVAGDEIFDTGGDVDLAAAYTGGYGKSGAPQFLELPFQAGPVTITVTAGVSYDFGVKISLTAGTPSPTECDPQKALFSTKATFAPYADLGVWATADASLAGIVGVGLEVKLTLVGLQLPLIVEADLGFDKFNNASMNFDATLSLDLHTLDGEIDFYIEAFWMKVATFTICKWDGFHHNFPIFRTPTVNLPLFEMPNPVQPAENSGSSETN